MSSSSQNSQEPSPGPSGLPNGTITPTREVDRSDADTPLRWHRSRNSQEIISASSEGSGSRRNLSSPAWQNMYLSSPLNYGTPASMASFGTPRSVNRNTPTRNRPEIDVDIRSRHEPRRVNIREPIPEETTSESERPEVLHIWGTNIDNVQVQRKFRRFIERFICPQLENDELPENLNTTEPLYLQKLNDIHETEIPIMNLNCDHLSSFDAELSHHLVFYPQEIIPLLDMTVADMYFAKYPDDQLTHQILIRPFNVPRTPSIRALNPENIDQLVTLHGMVTKTSEIMPTMDEAFFECIVCKFKTRVEVERKMINKEPTLCEKCNNRFTFGLKHNRSTFHDAQLIKLQESPDDMPPGQTPTTINLFLHGDLVDKVIAGDRVWVTGVYKAIPIQVMCNISTVKSVYLTAVEVLHLRKQDSQRLYNIEEGGEHVFPPERLEEIRNLSKKKDIYERLARKIAPSIYGNLDVKKAILLQLFSGTIKTHVVSGRSHFRSDIHILLCGDPGTSKSQMQQFVYRFVPRAQYANGQGTTAVGLTACVSKDHDSKRNVLQVGALVLANNGICCIDEFDKMDESARSVLHEVMEQQTLSIAKAGIICQLTAKTSILAAANPCGSQWDKNKTIIENIKLPPTLLSRFDLIFLMLDPQDEVFDYKLGRHLVNLYTEQSEAEDRQQEDAMCDMSLFRDYLAFAKEHINPKLNEEAQQKLIQAYVELRRVGNETGRISAYPRQLESLIRLSEAHAKVRLSNVVENEDVEEALRLYKDAMKHAATDPNTGIVDMSILTTGQAESERRKRLLLKNSLQALIKSKKSVKTLDYSKIFEEIKTKIDWFVSREMYEDALRDLQNQRLIHLVGKSKINVLHH